MVPARALEHEAHPWGAAGACPACAATPSEGTGLGGCVSFRLLFGGSLVRVVGTRCLHDGRELAAERCHASPVLYVSLAGASLLRVGRRRVQADPASAIWSRGGEGYEMRHPWGSHCQGCHVAFEPELGTELSRHLAGRGEGPHSVVLPVAAHLRLRRLLRGLQGGGASPLAAEEELVALAGQALSGQGGGSGEARSRDTRERHERSVARACELLQDRYRESLRLQDLARAACASPAHLTRIFRRQTGVSLHAYQTRLRLAAALESVLESGVDLSALAHDLGFASHSHLTSCFRREFGCTPSQLRAAGVLR